MRGFHLTTGEEVPISYLLLDVVGVARLRGRMALGISIVSVSPEAVSAAFALRLALPSEKKRRDEEGFCHGAKEQLLTVELENPRRPLEEG